MAVVACVHDTGSTTYTADTSLGRLKYTVAGSGASGAGVTVQCVSAATGSCLVALQTGPGTPQRERLPPDEKLTIAAATPFCVQLLPQIADDPPSCTPRVGR
jgi:hypothetical protein